MRILAVSDLHTDLRKNWQVIQQLSDTTHRDDVLIIAGDIASHIEIIVRTLALLLEKFRKVFYVPGNHELWVRNKQYNSLDKFFQVLTICDKLGIQTKPARIENIWIVPLFSWYSSDFGQDGHEYAYQLKGWTDFYSCRWPQHLPLNHVAGYFSKLNEPHIRLYDGPVISFSHFVPRLELLPPREYLFFKALPEVAGSELIEAQIRHLGSAVHVFGHSHIPRDHVIEGIRYVQNPFSSPRRDEMTEFPEKVVWQG